MEDAENRTITTNDVGDATTVVLGVKHVDLTPDETAYVRAKLARHTDVDRVRELRDNETKLPFIEGGRPIALKLFDDRIAELTAQQEG